MKTTATPTAAIGMTSTPVLIVLLLVLALLLAGLLLGGGQLDRAQASGQLAGTELSDQSPATPSEISSAKLADGSSRRR